MGTRSATLHAAMINRLERIGLLTLMALLTINIYTGGPLFAVWVGSRVQGTGPPSMAAIFAIVGTLGLVCGGLVWLMSRVGSRYDALSGKGRSVKRTVPWLRSMRGERPHPQRHARELSPLEIVLVVSVVLVVALFEVWFFFYSPSPIDQRSGRSHDAPLIG